MFLRVHRKLTQLTETAFSTPTNFTDLSLF